MTLRITGLSAAAMAMLLLLPSADAAVAGDRQVFPLNGFNTLHIDGEYRLDVTVGEPFKVELQGPACALTRAGVRVNKETLVLDQIDGPPQQDCGPLTARISVPELTGLSIHGDVPQATVRGIDGGRFEFLLEGEADIALFGQCDFLAAKLEGEGRLAARSLRCRDGNISVQGEATTEVSTARRFQSDIELGAGAIRVF